MSRFGILQPKTLAVDSDICNTENSSNTPPDCKKTRTDLQNDSMKNVFLGWDVADKRQLSSITNEDLENNKKWPPSNKVCQKLGVGLPNDVVWWAKHGLKPLCEWTVNAAGKLDYNTLEEEGKSSNSSTRRLNMNKIETEQMMDGGMHGVTDCWLPSTLKAIEALIKEPLTWCKHGLAQQQKKVDQLIKVTAIIVSLTTILMLDHIISFD